ncbi:hypothetical protein [Lignipirellula cremea]|uniref:Uncharacterized protein n=1 Tax=Lignipirellula cremea TaxID=2528010 RepID=A0A518DYD6_9BACT|nr:hypothetical protein [Lignipirellula cremea]QDU96857.1 hypothetical protein Pla8534_46790 [Lignipirellula cremea]
MPKFATFLITGDRLVSEQRCVVRAVSWRDLLPWLLIIRTFRMSIGISVLFLATVGAVLTPVGWRISEFFFVATSEDAASVTPDRTTPEFREAVAVNRMWASDFARSTTLLPRDRFLPEITRRESYALVYPQFTAPFVALFDHQLTLAQLAYFLFGGLWTLLVWAFLGAAITRTAAVQLGREERLSLIDALKHAFSKYGSYVAAPLYPLLATAAILSPAALLGFFFLGDGTTAVAGVLWVLVLCLAFLAVIFLVGLMFGWPLMWGAIASESSDAFDALSRSYAYTFQRPLHYLFYLVVALLLGLAGWAVIGAMAELVIYLGYWGASWGANSGLLWGGDADRLEKVLSASNPTGGLRFGLESLAFWENVVWTVAAGFRYAFFWCAITAIYLLLRRDVDQTEFDEIYVDDQDGQTGLPPHTNDSAGVAGAPQDFEEPHGTIAASTEPVVEREHPDGE